MSVLLRAALVATALLGAATAGAQSSLLNVSYDPTRELYQDFNASFARHWQAQGNEAPKLRQSHGGSGKQARSVADGLEADVVTLALAFDVDLLADAKLLPADWQKRLPHNSAPYTSTIVFVVRKGNPKQIRDWNDLARPGVSVVTPNPKTSGGARWNFLAAWGYVTVHQGRSEEEARAFVGRLFANVPKLDTGARGSTETFVRRKQGDVLIAWENEALLARQEAAGDDLEIVYPSVSIRAEPPVALVSKYAAERGTREVAETYLQFLYTPKAQDIIAKHGYRPSDEAAQKKYERELPPLKLFTLREVAGDWEAAQKKFFSDGGVFDQIYQKKEGR